ncbi:hypothetical protein BCV69DRAFT_131408 [Microstroma glucosiphilum]|uniref:Uncharacterized protein n=1 Tax=Pseudomicrostroma glucosiphilum TaxID=1684307 RepID=A0A316TVT6_9BASI|nr:hypothetical protein BCV69DRAFT_131408 [Pseudomicrostroma glucosiphilum]PWN17656.1 hypothetical protein BCV69DRAFT_131408 [Pseudomicrostroma glucosiphilum]
MVQPGQTIIITALDTVASKHNKDRVGIGGCKRILSILTTLAEELADPPADTVGQEPQRARLIHSILAPPADTTGPGDCTACQQGIQTAADLGPGWISPPASALDTPPKTVEPAVHFAVRAVYHITQRVTLPAKSAPRTRRHEKKENSELHARTS